MSDKYQQAIRWAYYKHLKAYLELREESSEKAMAERDMADAIRNMKGLTDETITWMIITSLGTVEAERSSDERD